MNATPAATPAAAAPHRARFRHRAAAALFHLALALAAFLVAAFPAAPLHAAGPAWWATQGAIDSTKTADDYAAANIGQLKHFATKAAAELDAKHASAGGAGTAIRDLVASWKTAPAAGVVRDDYAALTLGQLKHVGKLYYDRLAALGVIAVGKYPWRVAASNKPVNSSVATVGQLKTVFSFLVTVPATDTADEDGDGLPDKWELQHFGNLSRGANTQLTFGGLRVRDAYLHNLDPNSITDGTQTTPDSNDGEITPTPGTALSAAAATAQADILSYDSRGWLASAKTGTVAARAYTHDAEGNILTAKP